MYPSPNKINVYKFRTFYRHLSKPTITLSLINSEYSTFGKWTVLPLYVCTWRQIVYILNNGDQKWTDRNMKLTEYYYIFFILHCYHLLFWIAVHRTSLLSSHVKFCVLHWRARRRRKQSLTKRASGVLVLAIHAPSHGHLSIYAWESLDEDVGNPYRKIPESRGFDDVVHCLIGHRCFSRQTS